MSRPIIAICTALERAQWSVWDQAAALLPTSYVEAVQRAGGLVTMLPPDPQLTESPEEALQGIDGLMLAGGADIDPACYGQEPHPKTVGTVPERDAFEIALTRAAIALDMPLLGICRGMQVINVALGGTLVQHLPELYGHDRHLASMGTFDGADHDVALKPSSLAATVAGETVHVTKSHHHQGVDMVGEGLLVTGTDLLDGLPEAIELSEKTFVLGVQWHPEADESSPVIAAFVRAAQARRLSLSRPSQSAADAAVTGLASAT